VLSQSAKHYSYSGSQTEYFIRRKKSEMSLYVMKCLSSSSSLPRLFLRVTKGFASEEEKDDGVRNDVYVEGKIGLIVISYD
jgi:hypothetical protein